MQKTFHGLLKNIKNILIKHFCQNIEIYFYKIKYFMK